MINGHSVNIQLKKFIRKVKVLVSFVNRNQVHHLPAYRRFINRCFDYEDAIYDTQPFIVLI